MNWDCALTDKHREQYEQAIREVIVTSARDAARAGSGLGAVVRYVPPYVPGQEPEEHFELDALPDLASVEVSSQSDNREVSVTVYLSGVPAGATLTADEVLWDEYDSAPRSLEEGSPDGLGDLSTAYRLLADALLSTLAAYTDAPYPAEAATDAELERWWLGGEPRFVATLGAPGHYSFSATVGYTEELESVYMDGRRDISQYLGLPG